MADQTKAKVGVAAAAGAAGGGIFTFGVLQQLGMDQLFRSASTASSWLYAITITCILIVMILVTGYLVMQQQQQQQQDARIRTSPVFWGGMVFFGLIAISGFTYILLGDRTIMVPVVLGSGTDFTPITDDPQLTLSAYFDNKKDETAAADASDAKPIPIRENTPLELNIRNFSVLRQNYLDRSARLKALMTNQDQTADGATSILVLLKSACAYVPKNNPALQAACDQMTNTKPQT